jgi:hypothetical protein
MTVPDNFSGVVKVGKKSSQKDIYSFKYDLPYRSLRLCNLLALFVLIYDDGKVFRLCVSGFGKHHGNR